MADKKKKTTQRELLELVVAFIIAWIAYQALGFVMGTSLPIVSVVSDSMYHTDHFTNWWNANGHLYSQYNITRDEFRGFIAPNGLSRGDLLVVIKDDAPKIGDVLIYRRYGSSFTIVHRLVETGSDYYIVKGDNNRVADQPVARPYVVGRVVFAVPVLGYPRLLLHYVGI